MTIRLSVHQLEDRSTNEKARFPKKVVIVFLGKKKGRLQAIYSLLNWLKLKKPKLLLDFDQLACAHIILQMNQIQNLFEFQILTAHDVKNMTKMDIEDVPIITKGVLDYNCQGRDGQKEKGPRPNYIVQWFDTKVLSGLEHSSKSGNCPFMDYWIGITSNEIGGEHFQWTCEATGSGKIFTIMTSKGWQRKFSPPSVFEYIVISTFKCSLRSFIKNFEEFKGFGDHSETLGCIFDLNNDKKYRRISISNPNLCSSCEEKIQKLEAIFWNKHAPNISLGQPISKVLSRQWLGSLKEENSPVYNLKRNYGYDVDRNSGFYKKPLEEFRDSIIKNSAAWTIGGIIATALSVFGAYLLLVFHLKT